MTMQIVTSRLGKDRYRVAGTAEFAGYNKDIRADHQALVDWTEKFFRESTPTKWCPGRFASDDTRHDAPRYEGQTTRRLLQHRSRTSRLDHVGGNRLHAGRFGRLIRGKILSKGMSFHLRQV